MIVLDTNVISELVRPVPDARVVDWVSSTTEDIAITAITVAELLAGLRRLPGGRRKDELVRRITSALDVYRGGRAVLPFDDLAADGYADVLASRTTAGLPISTADAQIAGICLAHGATCATRNTKDFAKTGVDLIDPWSWSGGR